MKINNIERVIYDLVTLEDETLLRRYPPSGHWTTGHWKKSVWDGGEGWQWESLLSTGPLTLALEELYQGYEPEEKS